MPLYRDITMNTDKEQIMDLNFYSIEPADSPKLLGPNEERKKVVQLTALANSLKDTLESTGLKKWEITLEGYLEASSGIFPGGKAGFKATLRLSNS